MAIVINGDTDLNDLSRYNLSKLISYAEQNNHLFSGTIRENIFFGEQLTDEYEIPPYMKKFMLSLFNLKEGMNEIIVNDTNSTLSGGEKKKIIVSRALLRKSDVILLDEPTNALDSESIQLLFEVLNKIKTNKIVVVITHEVKYNSYADEVINFQKLKTPLDLDAKCYT